MSLKLYYKSGNSKVYLKTISNLMDIHKWLKKHCKERRCGEYYYRGHRVFGEY